MSQFHLPKLTETGESLARAMTRPRAWHDHALDKKKTGRQPPIQARADEPVCQGASGATEPRQGE